MQMFEKFKDILLRKYEVVGPDKVVTFFGSSERHNNHYDYFFTKLEKLFFNTKKDIIMRKRSNRAI